MYFESDEYPFKDVLSLIYDVHSEQDIKEVYEIGRASCRERV